jgi:hypothetical protein
MEFAQFLLYRRNEAIRSEGIQKGYCCTQPAPRNTFTGPAYRCEIKDTTGLLEGKYTDGRRIIKFSGLEDIEAKAYLLQKVVKDWLALVEK